MANPKGPEQEAEGKLGRTYSPLKGFAWIRPLDSYTGKE
jgi:hypothetical protein